MPRRSAGASEKNLPSLSSKRRMLLLSSLIVLIIPGIIFYRLVDIQLLDNAELIARGEDQRIFTHETPARRGDIYDSKGDLLATSLIRYTIWADPRRVEDPLRTAQDLAPLLQLSSDELHSRLTAQGAFSYLKRKVSQQTKDAVLSLELSGIHSYEEYARHYPVQSSISNSFLGFVGSEEQGLAGIEFSYNEQLVGSPGYIYLEGDPNGNPIALGERSERLAVPGASTYLTIDTPFQFLTEKILLEQVAETNSKSGTAIVMQPSTGRILSMATVTGNEILPDAQDPPEDLVMTEDEFGNLYSYEVSDENWAVTWTYEPGSVLKALTFSAILDTNTADPDSSREVPASIVLYDSQFEDHDWHPPTDMTVAEILRISSNIGTILWSQDLGKSSLYQYLQSFGIGSQLLREELPGESEGQLLEAQDWSGTSIATIALGQGVAMTPLQVLNVYNIIANDGRQIPPQLVGDVISAEGLRVGPDVPSQSQVISPETAHDLTDMLVAVVDSGTGKRAAVENYLIAGKTGTARKPLPTGGYEDEDGNYRYITTFAGFFPAEDPVISIIVVMDEPQNSIYASQTSAPTFALLAREAIRHFHIPPSVMLDETSGVQ